MTSVPTNASTFSPVEYEPAKYSSYVFIHEKQWFRRLVQNDKKDSLLDKCSGSNLIICCVTQYKDEGQSKDAHLFAGFESYIEFFHYSKKFTPAESNFFEVIRGVQKPHFDIDINITEATTQYPDNRLYSQYLPRRGYFWLSNSISKAFPFVSLKSTERCVNLS